MNTHSLSPPLSLVFRHFSLRNTSPLPLIIISLHMCTVLTFSRGSSAPLTGTWEWERPAEWRGNSMMKGVFKRNSFHTQITLITRPLVEWSKRQSERVCERASEGIETPDYYDRMCNAMTTMATNVHFLDLFLLFHNFLSQALLFPFFPLLPLSAMGTI